MFHLVYAPPTAAGFHNRNYAPDVWQMAVASKVAGFTRNMAQAIANISARGNAASTQDTRLIWDPNVVVP